MTDVDGNENHRGMKKDKWKSCKGQNKLVCKEYICVHVHAHIKHIMKN
jgi:hypothetical protein